MAKNEKLRTKDIAELLQPLLVDLIALAANGKQAHWHVRGRTFTQVHEQLDNIIDDARNYADNVAERVVALGVEMDGRPGTVAQTSSVPTFAAGFLETDAVVPAVIEQLDAVIDTARKTLEPLDDWDLPTQDVVIELLRGLEKHRWMMRAQT